MKKIISVMLTLVLIMTVASAGCISEKESVNPHQTASYTERNFDFVDTWIYTVDESSWMVLVLYDDGTGAIIGKNDGKAFELEFTWVENMLSDGARAGFLHLDYEHTSIILSTGDRDELLFFMSADNLDDWTPVMFVRYGSD